MLWLTTHTVFFFKKRECWFYEGGPLDEGGYTVYCNTRVPFTHTFSLHLEEQSARVELGKSTRELFAALNRTFRYHVRKGGRSGFVCEFITEPGADECERTIDEFDRFAETKGIAHASRNRILAAGRQAALVMTRVKKNGRALVTHLYLHDSATAILLHSFNHPESTPAYERGIANKFLHWNDMIFFKERGFTEYDLGGVNFESTPGISAFKMGLGAKVYAVHNYIRVKKWLIPFFALYKRLRHGS